LAILILRRASDKLVLGGLGLGLFILFSLQVEAKPLINFLNQNFKQTIFSGTTVLGLLVSMGGLGGVVYLLKKNRQAPQQISQTLGSLALLTFLMWSVGWGGVSTYAHMITNARKNDPIDQTFEQSLTLVPNTEIKILGPALLSIIYGESYRDINALVLDYFYSGQKRPWACIKRYRPEVVIIDEEIRRRFKTEPMSHLIKVPHMKLGTIPKNQHHSRLDYYQLQWKPN